jgi:tRNA-splicing ligase RtcB
VLIPGSNRDYSYVLMPEAGAAKSGYSVNHGAGRRLSRGEAVRQLDQHKVDEQYRRDGILVNLDGRVPLDESNACYKSAEEVVSAVALAKLARIEHTLWPLASIKGNEEGAKRARQRDKKGRDRERDKDRDAARKTKGHY